jgi:hypothetical protein
MGHEYRLTAKRDVCDCGCVRARCFSTQRCYSAKKRGKLVASGTDSASQSIHDDTVEPPQLHPTAMTARAALVPLLHHVTSFQTMRGRLCTLTLRSRAECSCFRPPDLEHSCDTGCSMISFPRSDCRDADVTPRRARASRASACASTVSEQSESKYACVFLADLGICTNAFL